MKLFEYTEAIALSITCTKKYNHCAFDGSFYYFTVLGALEVVKTDAAFQILECYHTGREYDCICYDTKAGCFWASSAKQRDTIYKLNLHLNEIDCTILSGHPAYSGCITEISYRRCSDSLLISFPNAVISTNKTSGASFVLYQSGYMQINSVRSLCPGMLISGTKNNEQYVYLLDDEGTVLYSHPIPYELRIQSILLVHCLEQDARLDFFVLKKGCYPYIYKNRLCIAHLPFPLCPCNETYSQNTHSQADTDCSEEAPAPVESGIMDSIAAIQAAVAELLQCESRQLERLTVDAVDAATLIMAQQEVSKAIAHAAQLEYLLYMNLLMLGEAVPCMALCCEDTACATQEEVPAAQEQCTPPA